MSAAKTIAKPKAIQPFEPPPPPRTPKSSRTRARLLAIAGEQFVERGYFAVSIRDIAEAAGLTNGAIYGHFRSKGVLLVEVIRSKLAERDAAIDFDAATDPTLGVRLMYDDDGRDTRVLQVDAASAARHDPDVAAGLAWLNEDRLARTRATLLESARDPDAAAWFLSIISSGIGMREAAELPAPPLDRVGAALLSAMSGLRDPLKATPST